MATAGHAGSGSFILISGSSHIELSKLISNRLDQTLTSVQEEYSGGNTSGHLNIHISDTVRGKNVFLIQTACEHVNDALMELLMYCYACKTSGANKIIGVIPCLPYALQCKMRKRSAIPAKLVAAMLCKAGLSHLITTDLRNREVQGFFSIPVDNLRCSPFLIQHLKEQV